MSRNENERVRILSAAALTGRANAELARALGLSVRQVQRLKKALREDGPAGLAHGNRGSRAGHGMSEKLMEQVLELYRCKYAGFNFSQFHGKLVEMEGVGISRSSVGRVLKSGGYASPRKRRPPKHRSRRERSACEGAMLQIDGSPHDWLEGRGPRLCLVGAVDDATGKVAGAVFREREDAQGYFLMMRQVLRRHGVPETVYHDRHGIFVRDPKDEEAIWEQFEGRRAPTQFGRLMEELQIGQIEAGSPQAKGRVERLWGTMQDRLVSELRLANARTLDEADEVLARVVTEHNRRFHRKPKDPQCVYRKPDKGLDLDCLFCFKYKRSVANDNTVSFYGRTIQIPAGPGGKSYAGRWVQVQERFDGSVHLYYREESLAKTSPPSIAPTVVRVRTSNGRYTEECQWTPLRQPKPTKQQQSSVNAPAQRQSHIPAPNHPWRKPWVTKSLTS